MKIILLVAQVFFFLLAAPLGEANAFDTASAVITNQGHVPTGWIIVEGTCPNGLLGRTDPAAKTITIDVNQTNALLEDVDVLARPGVLFLIMLHETGHACEYSPSDCQNPLPDHGFPGPYNNGFCGEMNLQKQVAAHNCLMANVVGSEGGANCALCSLYNFVQQKHNEKFVQRGVFVEPGVEVYMSRVEQNGCVGMTEMPDCPSCENSRCSGGSQ